MLVNHLKRCFCCDSDAKMGESGAIIGKRTSVKQTTIESSFKNRKKVLNQDIKENAVQDTSIPKVLSLMQRESMIPGLRSQLYVHLFSSYNGICVADIKENESGPGFIVKKRTGYSMEDVVVGGISSTISKFFSDKRGDEAIQKLYTTGQNKRSEKRYEKRAVTRGERIHQLVFHRVECCFNGIYRENSVLSSGSSLASSASSEECSCHRLVSEKEWSIDEIEEVNVIIRFLRAEMNLIPVFSELFVWSPDLDVATRIDLLCLDETARFVLISLKTGQYGRDEKPGETSFRFRGLFSDVRDSIRNRHDLQLLIELVILISVYRLPISDAFIVYSSGISESPCIIRRPNELAGSLSIPLQRLILAVEETLKSKPREDNCYRNRKKFPGSIEDGNEI